ncbi:acyl-CoA synthetase [Kineosporia sp. NBRC 101731]|uniref:acyl-CoA synthetase n=1 Tax=Kineosporia sp. NBRC 101731 TaxID=3032199 RepID=UPI0024A264DB|nr:acyl-CoA synthetase [Kineosporia sp. NBRC 101731]GLY31697.1 acyl-CoA synthetase [Kineosporia sp. NBRC 101731]
MPLLTSLTEPHPDQGDAVRVGEVGLGREQLLAAATAVADRVAGAKAVAIEATADARTVTGIVGCLLAGVPVVPVPPDSGDTERAHILRDCGADLVLDPQTIDPGARGTGSHPDPTPDSTALILYTSGTTGAPKGVPVTHAAIAACLDSLARAWDWTPDDTLVHGLPIFHVHGLVLGVLGPLRHGSRLVHTVRPKPAEYARAAREQRGSLFFGVPTVWSRVAADAPSAAALRRARLLVSGSAPLPAPVFGRVEELTGHRPVERYGMTETLITVSSRADGERRPGLVGVPLSGVGTRLVDDDGIRLPHDGEAVGELQVHGPTVFGGYLGRPDANASAFTPDGWFRTGDVATIHPDGWHRIVGRASTDLIKSGGYRIGAGEIEDVLLALAGVREVAVVGIPDDDLGERVRAFVVGEGIDEQQVIDHVATRLSVHKRPREVVFLPELPRNAMGKVVKQLLG